MKRAAVEGVPALLTFAGGNLAACWPVTKPFVFELARFDAEEATLDLAQFEG